jgi:hypothetical protein
LESSSWQNRFESLTAKWWFLSLMATAQLLPPYSSKGRPFDGGWSAAAALALHNPIFSPVGYYPLFKLIPLLVLILLFSLPRIGNRLLAVYAALNCVGIVAHQTIGITEAYGIVINTVGVLMFGLIAAVWAWDAVAGRTFINLAGKPWPRYWPIAAGLLALWYPLDSQTLLPNFHWRQNIANGAGLAFCTTIPFYLGLLTFSWPNVNSVTLRITSLIGLMVAVYTFIDFASAPGEMWWNGVLHLPLLSVCGYGVCLSLRGPDGLIAQVRRSFAALFRNQSWSMAESPLET